VKGLRLQFGVIRRSRGFRLLFLASMGSTLGTLIATLALVVDIKNRTNSGPWVSALLIAQFLPSIAVGLLFAPLLDRLSRRGTMIVADLARAAIFVGLAFTGRPGTIVALAGLSGLATGFFRPAAYAGLPNLVASEDLSAANSLLQTAENVSWAVGPVIGGILVSAAGTHVAYWINATSFVVSAALLAGIPARLLQAAAAVSRGHLRDLRDGLAFVLRTHALRTVLIAWSVALISFAAVNTTEVFLAKDSLNAGDFGYGLIYGASGLGLAIGSLMGGRWVERRPVRDVYTAAIFVNAIGFATAAVSPNVWVAAACCLLGGIGNGSALLCNALFVQRSAPDEIRGRAFTVIMAVNYVAFGGGFVAGGLLRNAYGPRWVWGISAILLAFAGVIAFALTRGVRTTAQPEAEPAI
jgi:MFS family permease